jgi:predicted secreted Zn-dependent protease
MFRESFLALAILCSLPTSTLLMANDSSQIVYYGVQGKTAAEVYSYIKTKAPRVAANATFAFTLIATKYDKWEVAKPGSCYYGKHKTSAYYAFHLPRHIKISNLPASTRSKWLTFVDYLKVHEAAHRTIWQKCFADFDTQAKALRAKDCDSLNALREQKFNVAKRLCVQKDEAFDSAFRKQVLLLAFMREALARTP